MNELREYIRENSVCPYNQVREAIKLPPDELRRKMVLLIEEGFCGVFPAEGELHVVLHKQRNIKDHSTPNVIV